MNWVKIKGNWQINENLQIRHIKNKKILKLRLRRDGYIDVKLSLKRYLFHRLLAEAFIPNPDNKEQVNHINGIRSDNRLENLEWATQSENIKHAFKIGLHSSRTGECNNNCKINIEVANHIKTLIKSNIPMVDIAKTLNLPYTLIANIKYNRSWAN